MLNMTAHAELHLLLPLQKSRLF